MTQLDSITWAGQILWFFIIFLFIYCAAVYIYIPVLFMNQFTRYNKIKKHYNLSVFYDYLNVSQKFNRFFIIGNNF